MHNPDSPEFYNVNFETQVLEFIDQHREMLLGLLDGVSEEEARLNLVDSKTTLLGLVKHAVFVEQVWFQEATTGKSREELGIAATPDDSFVLTDNDTIETISHAYRETIQASNKMVRDLSGEEIFTGNRRGALSLRWIYLHLLRELAQHCGHGDILREQILSKRGS